MFYTTCERFWCSMCARSFQIWCLDGTRCRQSSPRPVWGEQKVDPPTDYQWKKSSRKGPFNACKRSRHSMRAWCSETWCSDAAWAETYQKKVESRSKNRLSLKNVFQDFLFHEFIMIGCVRLDLMFIVSMLLSNMFWIIWLNAPGTCSQTGWVIIDIQWQTIVEKVRSLRKEPFN